MSNIILLGENNKRYSFFNKAAKDLKTSVTLLRWSEFSLNKINGKVKIDPPIYFDRTIKEHNESLKKYRKNLASLSTLKNIKFLNSPMDILILLDKEASKDKLSEKNIPVTPALKIEYKNFEEFFHKLKDMKEYKVFIKPRYGSGAMGIIAMKMNPRKNDVIFYTTLRYSDQNLYNTKKINRITGFERCKNMFDQLFNDLKGEIIVEKWLVKDKYENENYDLRVLYQDKKIVYMVGRKSKGPITNLHLNNGSFDIGELNLPEDVLKQLEELGEKIFDIFKDLKIVGADVLISPKKEIFIIELNGQGDQIYSDMYNENNIYTEQIRELITYE